MIIVYTADIETAVKLSSLLGGASYRGSYIKEEQLPVVIDEVIKEAKHYGYVKTMINNEPAAFVWGKGIIRPITVGDSNPALFPLGPAVFFPDKVHYAAASGKEQEAETLSQIFNNAAHQVIYDATIEKRNRLDFVSVYCYTGTATPVRKVCIELIDRENVMRAFSNPMPYEPSELDLFKDKTYQYVSYLANTNLGLLLKDRFPAPFPKIGELPILYEVVKRNTEIECEKTRALYHVDIELLLPDGRKISLKSKSACFSNKAEAEAFCQKIPAKLPITITENTVREKPEGPHSVKSLEKEALSVYGYAPEETKLILSSLHASGFISSQVTASRKFAAGSEAEVLKLIKNLEKSKAFGPLLANLGERVIEPSCFGEDKKAGLLITRKMPDKTFHDSSLRNVYYLICKEIVKCILGEKITSCIQIEGEIDGCRYAAREKFISKAGYSILDGEEESECFPKYLTGLQELPITFIMRKESPRTLMPYKEASFVRQYAANSGCSQDEVRKTIKAFILMGLLIRDQDLLLPTERGISLIHYLADKEHLLETAESWNRRIAALYSEKDMEKAENLGESVLSDIKNAVLSWHGMFDTAGAKSCSVNCPDCGQVLQGNANGIFCASCGFKIKRLQHGKKLSDKHIECLIKHGSTPLLEGFMVKEKPACGRVYFEDKNLFFTEDSIYQCPGCRTHLRVSKGKYYCRSCGFELSPSLFSYMFKKTEFEELLYSGQSPLIEGLVDDDGCIFSGVVYLDPDDSYIVKCIRIE